MSAPDQDQRRFDPTPRRVEEFRKRGQIATSRDLVTALALAGGAASTLSLAASTGASLRDYMASALLHGSGELPTVAINHAAQAFWSGLAPTAAGALAGLVVAGAVQLGPRPTTFPLKLDLSRIFSPDSIGNLFSPKAQAGRALKAVAKLAVVGAAGYLAIDHEWTQYLKTPAFEPGAVWLRGEAAISTAFRWAGSALVGLAIIDFAQSKRSLMAQMRMTLEELKREMREQEGDPAVKRKRRQRMRELSKKKNVAAVKSSDVVLVNPTEFAVAIRYRSKKDRAPRVVAKGKGKAAERIRELARGAGVPIVTNIPLARFLFRAVKEGQEIPPNVYQAVAEILGYVYRLQRRVAR
ncbi:MAG: EscU/YscU/HrcU family type III secretion system export apparatus switch protein [Myxococcota bacterium]